MSLDPSTLVQDENCEDENKEENTVINEIKTTESIAGKT